MEMFQKAPSVETKSLRKPQSQNNQRSLQYVIYFVTYCNTGTPATHIQFSSPHDWLIQQQPCTLNCRFNGQNELEALSYLYEKDGMVSGCIFILLHSHGASRTRLSKNNCQTDDEPHYHIYQHASPQRRYIVSAFHIQNEGKVWTLPSRLLAFRTVTTSVSGRPYFGSYTNIKKSLMQLWIQFV